MKALELNDTMIIAKGGERTCYAHPKDVKKVIKIVHTLNIHNKQNELEYSYMNYLVNKNTDLSALTKCYGYISTNKGKGLIFDRVLDFDGSASKSFRYMLAKQLIPLEEQKILINDLKIYLEKNNVLFVDTSLTNIFCPRISENVYRLIIVDGLGAKRLGLKFFLYKLSKTYTKYKIKRQWQKFMQMYKKDLKRVALGERPFTRL